VRLYGDLAPWFHLLTAPEDYAAEAERYRRLILDAVPDARTLLELGSGGGNNASHLRADFACTLSDVSPQMLDLSRRLNPGCEHVLGDMRTLRLGRTFDAVFVHDAIAYMATEDDLRDCLRTAFAHTRPGGIALFVPDFTRETFAPGTSHGGHDGADGRSLRYL
jgi:SAM-dependent methyltransferase